MMASRTFTHREYVEGIFKREETSEVALRIEDRNAGITIDYDERNIEEDRREATTLEIQSIEIQDIQRICSTLASWCGGKGHDRLELDTGYVNGSCSRDGQAESVERLSLGIERSGLRISAKNGSNTIGTVKIPPRSTTEASGSDRPTHLFAFNAFLHSALSCAGHFDSHPGPRLDAAGEFTGPLRPEIRDLCVPQYNRGNHSEAILNAGQQVERSIKDLLGGYEDVSGTSLMATVFRETDPVLRLSEDDEEQKGVRFLFQGAIKALRNPLTHRTPRPGTGRFPDTITPRHARDALYFFDLLYLILEEAERTDE